MPDGGELTIETANIAGDSEAQLGGGPSVDRVRVSVTDIGTGMTPDVARRAFEPFFTTKPPGKGTGLGLSSVYGLAHQLGGDASLVTAPGRGTTVLFEIPRIGGIATGVSDANSTAEAPPGKGESVLLVEDDDAVRRVTRERLERLGYNVTEAASGPQAIAALTAESDFALVFSDVVMPGGISGFDLARWMREKRPKTPILLTTGYAGEIKDGDEPGAPPILRKPYALADLARALRAELGD